MLSESFKMAVKAVSVNKLRAFLTMLGIIIGVMALVVLVSLANGTTRSVSDSISSLGTNTLTVEITDNKGVKMNEDELAQLADSSDAISLTSVVMEGSATTYSDFSKKFSSDSETASTTIYGTGSSYGEIAGLNIGYGRYFNITDVDNHTNVIIISHDLAEDIMGGDSAVGSEIKLDGTPFSVIGVIEEQDSESSSISFGPGGRDSSDQKDYTAYIPYTSYIRLSGSEGSEITKFMVSASSDDLISDAEKEVKKFMLKRSENDSDAFSVLNQSEIASTMEDVENEMAMMLGGIAAISLIVGGIGIMNVMLVSVTERTREIGIRKAIGAKRISIMSQFLIEAVIVSLMGCMTGIAGSFILLGVMSKVTGTSYAVSPGVAFIAVAFSTLIGILFGSYPAAKAAGKNPIECLRYTG